MYEHFFNTRRNNFFLCCMNECGCHICDCPMTAYSAFERTGREHSYVRLFYGRGHCAFAVHYFEFELFSVYLRQKESTRTFPTRTFSIDDDDDDVGSMLECAKKP